MDKDNYYYELNHVCNGAKTTVKFEAGVHVSKFKEHLTTFMLAATWHPSTIDKMFNETTNLDEGN